MNDRYPRIRVPLLVEDELQTVLRESLSFTFYMHRDHREVSNAVMSALERYCHVIGQGTLSHYAGYDGYWHELDRKGWAFIHKRLLGTEGANVELRGKMGALRYEFNYHGRTLEDPRFKQWNYQPTSAVAFWLPTEFLEEHGPGRVRELALELGMGLPFGSGQAGLSFHMMSWLSSNTPTFREKSPLHPGLDLQDPSELANHLGTKVRGPAWLTFLGQPVLGELGGAEGLRARLHSPGTTVQELEGNRAVVTLGEWPEAGDLSRGDTLPHYRELARVLEPWLYVHKGPWGNLSEAEIRRWERRFLD